MISNRALVSMAMGEMNDADKFCVTQIRVIEQKMGWTSGKWKAEEGSTDQL